MRAAAEALYRDLRAAGIEVLFDDRPERAGVKFNDADLLGLPLWLTLGRRMLQQDAVEVKARASGELRQEPLAGAVAAVCDELDRMRTEIVSQIRPVVFDAR